MPFEKVETQVDFPALERDALQFWDERRIFDQLREKNRGKPKWSFLDGPITANNPMGVHHAWGRTYKDAYNRYFAMTGHEQRYQNGFDCQGLWVEVEVEKELGLKSKRDIENLVPGDREASVARFVQLCKQRVDKFARIQTDQSIRLGYWMDWDRDADWEKSPDERKSYFTMSEENNYTIWAFLKKCHGKGMIYRGYDSMPWCGRCGVGISEQEMKEGYRLVEHKACFVRLPLADRPGENLLVWTTTPWTLTSNVGAAINPDLTYLKVRLKGEVYYVSKGAFKLNRMESSGGEDDDTLSREAQPSAAGAKKPRKDWLDGVPHLKSIEQLFKEKAGKDGFEVIGEVKGEELLGWRYVGPFDDLPAQQHPHGYPAEVARIVEQRDWAPAKSAAESHRVISGGKDVTETEGTGIVHTAPGCGQIDFQWGKDNGLPPVAPIGESGDFHDGFGPLTGKNAADPATADAVFEELRKKDVLFATERYVHRYPHCWRCKTELLYRLVDEWFIDMGPQHTTEGFRGEIMKVVDQVKFLPESINGRARERDWLWNMGNWMISKKRYWGLALPIWVDDVTGEFEVIGSREELKERAVEGWDEFNGNSPHRPHVDRVKIRNPKTGNLMSRIPDVGNPWLDAGIVAFSTLGYNHCGLRIADCGLSSSIPQSAIRNPQWEEWYPADFITESFPGQFRNWFYSLLAMSTMMADGQRPFKTLLGHGLVRDQDGNPMHKSDGNSIEFIAAADDGFTLVQRLKPNEKLQPPDGSLGAAEIQVTDKETGKPARAMQVAWPPIGADVMRWLYCRQNPAANLNFGPVPAREVRGKFHIKLWNCYAFFANYARLDGFDPAAPQVPVSERADIDRWILSDLQGLIRTAREAFESYDVMRFCLEAERFVDDRLSNWYVRRNRERFWSKNAELNAAGRKDKLAGYQTLYAVLTTLAKLIAPVVPFLAEVMYRNLRTEADPESVHLYDYPIVDESLVDHELSRVMRGLLRLVSHAMNLRNLSKQKVRQPLAELVVQPGSDGERMALAHFAGQLLEEINVKELRIHDRNIEANDLVDWERKLNPKVVRQYTNEKYQEVYKKLEDWQVTLFERQSGSPPDVIVDLPDGSFAMPFEAVFRYKVPEGWVGGVIGTTQMILDTRIIPELKAEGLARDVIRLVQDERKKAGLDVADKIALYLGTESDALTQAIAAHKATIAAETQATTWLDAPPAGGHTAAVKVDGQPLTVALRKV